MDGNEARPRGITDLPWQRAFRTEGKETRTRWRFGAGDASAILAGILWGVNYPVTKWVLQSIPEGQFLVLRFGAAACVFALLLALREKKIPRPEMRSLLVLGLLGVGVYNILFTMGIHRTSASTAALIISTSPLITGVWCALTGREPFAKRRCVGTLTAFAGVILVLVSSHGGFSFAQGYLAGNALIACGAFLFALYAVLARPLLEIHSPVCVTSLVMIVGSVVLLPFGLWLTPPSLWVRPSAGALFGMGYIVLFGTVAAFTLWYRGVRDIGPVGTVLYHFVTPTVSMVVAPVLLGDATGGGKIVGAAFVLAGLLVARQSRSR